MDRYSSSALDFMVVSASASSDVDTLRSEALTQNAFVFSQADRRVLLTQRPYRCEEGRELLDHLQSIKKLHFPRSHIHYLYEGLFHSQAEARFRWRRVAARVKNSEHRRAMDDFDRVFGDGGGGLSPWRKQTNPMTGEEEDTCAFGDLVEIYPFTHG